VKANSLKSEPTSLVPPTSRKSSYPVIKEALRRSRFMTRVASLHRERGAPGGLEVLTFWFPPPADSIPVEFGGEPIIRRSSLRPWPDFRKLSRRMRAGLPDGARFRKRALRASKVASARVPNCSQCTGLDDAQDPPSNTEGGAP
jgi:hypothetical protein